MKTIRLNTFETNSSSTHTLTITSGKKWDEFEAGTALYNNDYEKLYGSEELYTMFIEGDDDGDFKCDEYETYLKEKGCEKLSLDEFRYVIDHDFIAERCRQDRGFTFSDEICSEMDKKFGAAIQLNKEVFAIISRWMILLKQTLLPSMPYASRIRKLSRHTRKAIMRSPAGEKTSFSLRKSSSRSSPVTSTVTGMIT